MFQSSVCCPQCSKLVHDAVRVAAGHGAILAKTAPLEGRAERADLVLLVLLLLGKFHEQLRDAAEQEHTPRTNLLVHF